MNISKMAGQLSSVLRQQNSFGGRIFSQVRNDVFANLAPVARGLHPAQIRSPLKDVGTLQARTKFTLVSTEEFEVRKRELESQGKTLESPVYHGTTRWAAEEMARRGVDLTLTGKYHRNIDNLGKYLGAKSGAGTGLYCVDNKAVAEYYALRASVGEPLAFDLDTRKTILAVHRVRTDGLKKAVMPRAIVGKPDEVREFRANNRVHEIELDGPTPVPKRLVAAGIEGKTTLITDEGLMSDEVEYIARIVERSNPERP